MDAVSRILAPLRTRIANMVSRAVVRMVRDAGGLQVVQLGVLDGETRDDIERVQQYGLTSVPLEGAEAVVLFVGGRRDHGLVVAVDDRRHRPAGLEPGEVCLYSKHGQRVTHRGDGSTEIAASEVRLGAEDASEPVALAVRVEEALSALKSAIENAQVAPQDGGAMFQQTLVEGLSGWPDALGAEKVKAI